MSSEKLVNFRCDDELYQKLKELALKERKTVKDLISQQISEYVKVHGDGNPQYTIDQFEDINFMACPAFYRPAEAWDSYLKKQDMNELQKVRSQILLIEKQMMQYL